MTDREQEGLVGWPPKVDESLLTGELASLRRPQPQPKTDRPAGHDCYALVRHPVQGRGAEYQCPSCEAVYVVKRKTPPVPEIGMPVVGGP